MLSARETFHAGLRTIVAGELVEDDDAVVAGNEHLFGAGVDCPTCQAGTDAAAAALEAVTAERDAAVAAATEAAKTTTAKAKG